MGHHPCFWPFSFWCHYHRKVIILWLNSFNTSANCYSCWTKLLILSPQTFIMLPWICLTSSLHWNQSFVFDGASVNRLSLSSATVQLLGLSSVDTVDTGISGDVSTGHDCLIFDSKFWMDSKISKSRLKWGASRYPAGPSLTSSHNKCRLDMLVM